MTLKTRITQAERDSLPEAVYNMYVPDGDDFRLEIDDIKSHPAVKALSVAHGRTKAELREVKAKADRWDELVELRGDGHITPDSVHYALDAKPVGDEDVQKQIEEAERRGAERAEAKAKRELDKLQERTQRLDAALRTRTVDGDLDAAIAKAGVKESLRPAARAFLLQKRPEMIEEDGDFRGIFKSDPDGIPRDLSVSEYVSEWIKSDEAAAFLPASEGGSGAGDSGGPAVPGAGRFDTNDPVAWGRNAEKIAAGEMQAS